MQKLMPCQPYLKLPETAPATCCVPLKDMITTEAQCLCSVLTNARVLQSFNVTEADAMNLLKVCGAQADLSSCKNATSPTSSPDSPPSSSLSEKSSPPPSSSTPERGGHWWSQLERCGFISIFLVVFFLALSP
ncbi:hypothetical protein MANES_06G004400v8 [Manihot esculenta]|uniref:Uncharacterized protein n=1 Tax=Manihot esculenta TaxID=3983 RepID=A0ACB7HIU1_MANES|nr:hypothetical protein MANES_06G004400v8 [Manihot esculenta]